MADDNTARFRSSDPHGRGPGPSAPASDPLAELARLIGQSDPFADFGRDNRQPSQRDGVQYGNDPNYDPASQPAPEPYSQEPAPYGHESRGQESYGQTSHDQVPRDPVPYDHQPTPYSQEP